MPEDIKILTLNEYVEITRKLHMLQYLTRSCKQTAHRRMEESFEFFQKSLFVCNDATLHCEFAIIAYDLELNNYALCCFERSIELYEEYYNKQSPIILNNIKMARLFIGIINQKERMAESPKDLGEDSVELKPLSLEEEGRVMHPLKFPEDLGGVSANINLEETS